MSDTGFRGAPRGKVRDSLVDYQAHYSEANKSPTVSSTHGSSERRVSTTRGKVPAPGCNSARSLTPPASRAREVQALFAQIFSPSAHMPQSLGGRQNKQISRTNKWADRPEKGAVCPRRNALRKTSRDSLFDALSSFVSIRPTLVIQLEAGRPSLTAS